MSARDVFRSAGRILVKLDSSIVTRSNGTGLALGRTANIVEQGKFQMMQSEKYFSCVEPNSIIARVLSQCRI